MITNIGMILLAVLLILMAIVWFGVTAIPDFVLGLTVEAIVAAILILAGK